MDFKKRIIEELKLSELQANTLLKDYISTCEKLAKEYHNEQLNLHVVSNRRELLKLKEFAKRQENLPNDIYKIVNNNFWDLI